VPCSRRACCAPLIVCALVRTPAARLVSFVAFILPRAALARYIVTKGLLPTEEANSVAIQMGLRGIHGLPAVAPVAVLSLRRKKLRRGGRTRGGGLPLSAGARVPAGAGGGRCAVAVSGARALGVCVALGARGVGGSGRSRGAGAATAGGGGQRAAVVEREFAGEVIILTILEALLAVGVQQGLECTVAKGHAAVALVVKELGRRGEVCNVLLAKEARIKNEVSDVIP
jgi:hypothetical protein